jgi:hypothetical protein
VEPTIVSGGPQDWTYDGPAEVPPPDNVRNKDLYEKEGPCRDTAMEILNRRILAVQRELKGTEELLRFASSCKAGSPGEDALYHLLLKAGIH